MSLAPRGHEGKVLEERQGRRLADKARSSIFFRLPLTLVEARAQEYTVPCPFL